MNYKVQNLSNILQSLRASPFDDSDFSALVNHKNLLDRELISVHLPVLINTPKYTSSESKINSNNHNIFQLLYEPSLMSSISFSSQTLQINLSALWRESYVVTDQFTSVLRQQIKNYENIGSESNNLQYLTQFVLSTFKMNVVEKFGVDTIIIKLNGEVPRAFCVHYCVLATRCPFLLQHLNQDSLNETRYYIIDICDIVNNQQCEVFPLLLEYLYSDTSFPTQGSFGDVKRLNVGLSILSFRKLCLEQLLSSRIEKIQLGLTSRVSSKIEELICLDSMWKQDFFASKIVQILEKVSYYIFNAPTLTS
jgi:hypothetical protein